MTWKCQNGIRCEWVANQLAYRLSISPGRWVSTQVGIPQQAFFEGWMLSVLLKSLVHYAIRSLSILLSYFSFWPPTMIILPLVCRLSLHLCMKSVCKTRAGLSTLRCWFLVMALVHNIDQCMLRFVMWWKVTWIKLWHLIGTQRSEYQTHYWPTCTWLLDCIWTVEECLYNTNRVVNIEVLVSGYGIGPQRWSMHASFCNVMEIDMNKLSHDVWSLHTREVNIRVSTNCLL